MKKILLIVFTCLATLEIHAQDKTALYGDWRIEKEINGNTILTKVNNENPSAMRWGQFMSFQEGDIYNETGSAPCGLDDNHYSYQAKWTYQMKDKTIEIQNIQVINDRPNIYSNYQVLKSGKIKVISVTANTLTIKVVKAWEKVTAKK